MKSKYNKKKIGYKLKLIKKNLGALIKGRIKGANKSLRGSFFLLKVIALITPMEKVKFLLNKKLELNKGKLWRKIQKRYRLKWLKMLWSRKLNNINLKLWLDNKKNILI